MPVDPTIARGIAPIDVSNTLAQIAMLRQRDQALADDRAQTAALQQQIQAKQQAEAERERALVEAISKNDWKTAAVLDPEATREIRAWHEAERPPQPEIGSVSPGDFTPESIAAFAQSGDYTQLQRYERPTAGGSIRLPDGTVINTGGGQYAPTELGKATRTDLEKGFTQSQGNLLGLQQQLQKWRPEFSTYAGQAKAAVGDMQDKAGGALGEVSPEQRQYLDDFSSWKSDTSAALSQYLNQLSGAAISPAEEARLKASFPNDNDGPTKYQSKLRATMKRLALVQARSAYLLSNPSISLDAVSLDKMQEVMLSQANALAADYERRGMPKDQARQQAIQDTRTRYGVGGVNGQ